MRKSLSLFIVLSHLLFFSAASQKLVFFPSPPFKASEGKTDAPFVIGVSLDSTMLKNTDSVKVIVALSPNLEQQSATNGSDFYFKDDTLLLVEGNGFKGTAKFTLRADHFSEKQETFQLVFRTKSDTQAYAVLILDRNDDTPAASEESYFETLITDKEVPLELQVFRNDQGYFNLRLRYTNGDSANVAKSNLYINENFEYSVFKAVVQQLLKDVLGQNVKEADGSKTVSEYQLSKLHSSIFQKMKIKNSPEVKALKERLDAYEEVDAAYAYGGIFKIRKDVVKTYKQPHQIKHILAGWKTRYKELHRNGRKYYDPLEKYFTHPLQLDSPNKKTDTLHGKPDSSIGITQSTSLEAIFKTEMGKLVYDSLAVYYPQKDFENAVEKALKTETPGRFYIDSVFVSIFNNAVDKMAIYGTYTKNEKDSSNQATQYNHPIRAQNTSFGLRELNTGNRHFVVNQGPVNSYSINLSELLEFIPYKEHFNYIAKDQSFMLRATGKNPKRSAPIERRALYDYLTVVTFLDFLGINNNINNNFIQIEGRTRFPLNLSTNTRWGPKNMIVFPMFESYLNASFVNGNNLGGRKAPIFSSVRRDTLFFDNFDLLRDYNVRAGVSLSLASFVYKQIHSRIYVNYDAKMFRTAFGYTGVSPQADTLYESNIFSLSHGPSVMFEYRPDFNIGADLRLSVDFRLKPLNFRNNALKYLPSKGPIFSDSTYQFESVSNRDKQIYGLELNIYSFLNPHKTKNDGLYFRFAFYTNRQFNQISPYLMAGYATSLSGLVKKSSTKTKKESPNPAVQ